MDSSYRAEPSPHLDAQRWQLALEGADDGVWDWRIQTGEVFYSARLHQMLGYADGELAPHIDEWKKRVHPADWQHIERELNSCLEGRTEHYTTEYRLQRKDGGYCWTRARGKVIARDPLGLPLRMVGTLSDISDHKRTEAALRESEAKLRNLFENLHAGVVVHGAETDIIMANPSACRILGLSLEQMQGRIAPDPTWQFVREDGTPMPLEEYPVSRVLSTRRAIDNLVVGVKRAAAQDLVWVLVNAYPEFDLTGKLEQIVVIIIDITEQQRSAERLRVQGAALDAAASEIFITDATGVIQWVNHAFIRSTGYSAAEAIGRTPRILKSDKHPPEFFKNLWDTVLSGQEWRGIIEDRRKDGTCFSQECIITPVRSPKGLITHFVSVRQDITERRALEQQAFRNQRMDSIGMLAGGIAHDLNNILVPIFLSVDLLRLETPDPKVGHALDVIQSAAKRADAIIKQVLTFARGIDGERVSINPSHLIREVVTLAQQTFPRNIAIVEQIPANLPAIAGDLTQLHQVLLNLAVNARDAMPSGGKLSFTCAARQLLTPLHVFSGDLSSGTYLVIAIEDTGTGMTAENMERMFEPFFTTKPLGEGTGLGLPTALGIIRSHGGAIDAQSKPGLGTKFQIYLPINITAHRAESSTSEAPPFRGKGQTILVVDDESSIREMVKLILEQSGFKVLEAADGDQAVAFFHKHRNHITAVLMDMMMPTISGEEAAQRILQLNPQLPIIFMSGLLNQDAVQATLGYLHGRRLHLMRKPFTGYGLLKHLEHALQDVQA